MQSRNTTLKAWDMLGMIAILVFNLNQSEHGDILNCIRYKVFNKFQFIGQFACTQCLWGVRKLYQNRYLHTKTNAECIPFCVCFLSKSQTWHRRSQARYSVASLLTSPHEVWWISSAPYGGGYHHASACIFCVLIFAKFCDIINLTKI